MLNESKYESNISRKYVDVLHYGEHREKASDTRHVTRSGTGLVVMQATNDNRLKLQPAVA